MRLVSEMLASNGSSSMASVCGSSAGADGRRRADQAPVAGVAMGLVTGDDGKYQVLTDIQGIEDDLGDMDFKVAGTAEGVTALQMDIKTTGITYEIMREAFAQAREGRLFILGKMDEVIAEPRAGAVAGTRRGSSRIQINPEKIGALIGPGGKMIRCIIEEYRRADRCRGRWPRLRRHGRWRSGAEAAQAMIEGADARDQGRRGLHRARSCGSCRIGAFVNLMPGKDGMVHVSELAEGRVENVEDVVKLGDEINVMVIDVEPGTGKVSLSRRAILTGESPEDRKAAGAAPRARRRWRLRRQWPTAGLRPRSWPRNPRNGGERDRNGGDRGPRR